MAVLVLVATYLLGSIPFGVLFARTAGIDVRRAGSRNIGATNVARTAGMRLGLATLAADAAKGAVSVGAARWLDAEAGVAAAAGIAAFLGHVYPPRRLGGGKGVATGLGALLVLSPVAAGAAVAVFVLALAASGMVSVASMSGAVMVPAALALLGAPAPVIAVGLVMAVVIIIRHRENVRRIQVGTEPRVRLRKKQAQPTE